jgi:glucuronate isomerase
MATELDPQLLKWRMSDVVAYSEAFVAAHGAGFPDGLAASIVAEENVRRHYARHGARISDHELAIFGQEVVMAFNRQAQARDRAERAEWLADHRAGMLFMGSV